MEVLQLDGEIDYNNALIEEREAGIAEIQSQIGEVNEIFQDLAVLVNEQGTMIDDIEANIIRTSAKTKEARPPARTCPAPRIRRAARARGRPLHPNHHSLTRARPARAARSSLSSASPRAPTPSSPST